VDGLLRIQVIGSCRVFETWQINRPIDSLGDAGAPHGNTYIELNAYNASMAYQPICMVGGEVFDFAFYHHSRSANATETVQFRFGIPTGLTTGSRTADSYSRPVIQGATTQYGSNATLATYVITPFSGTSNTQATVFNNASLKNWIRYTGTHAITNAFGGIRNLGFYGITPTGGSGNMLDAITIDLVPIMDMGASRDQSGLEGTSPTTLKIRINGKVTTGTVIAVRRKLDNPGTATSDTDFTLGTPTAGVYGNATVTHTTGSDLWHITVPPGYYDGGMVPGNNQGGLTIPITYVNDSNSEGTEWAWFELARPTKDGSSPYFSSDLQHRHW